MKKLLITLAAFLAVFTLFGVSVIHVEPQDLAPGKDAELLLEIVTGEDEISAINILYNVADSSIRQRAAMRPESEDNIYWRGTIPRTVVMASAVEYRFEIVLKSGQAVLHPEDDGIAKPYILQPLAPSGRLSRDFVLISDEDVISADEGYVLAVSFFALEEDIDISSIKVYVDDKDVTSQTTIEGSFLMYRENRPKPGLRKAIVMAKVKGRDVFSETWIIQVLPGTLSSYIPFDYRGSVSFSANIYNVGDEDLTLSSQSFGDTQKDFNASAELFGTYGPVDVETNMLFSSLEDKNQQPVNRFMIGMQLPFMKAYWGDYAPNLSHYTLSGKNVRGAYIDLHAQYLKFILSHGEAVRKTTDEENMTGTFKQESFGTRLQFGSDDGFRFGLNVSRHRDLISSLEKEYYERVDDDGEITYAVNARDNAVLSFDAQLNVPDQNVLFGFEMAGSLLNANTIPGILTDAEIEEYFGSDIPFTPENLADLFVINRNMEPFIPGKANMAYNAYARMFMMNNLINVQYSSVGPAFNSFGSFYQANDTKTLSITDQITIGRVFFLYGGFSQTEDNISKFNTETNVHTNMFAQMVLRFPNLPYLKASFLDNVGENNPLDEEDSASTDLFMPNHQKLRNMSFGLGYNFKMIPFVPTQFDISYRMGSSSNEQADSFADALELKRDNKTDGISFTMLNRFSTVPLKTHFSFSNSKIENLLDKDVKPQKNNSFFAKADYSLWEDRIIPFASYRNTSLSAENQKHSHSYMNVGLESFPIKDLSVCLDLGRKSFKNANDDSEDHATTTVKFLVTQRF